MLVQLSILALCHTVLAMPGKPVYDVEDLARVQMLFEDFMIQYHRTYDGDEKMERLQYFKQNLVKINLSNERNPLALFDINKFADLSPEELQNLSRYRRDQSNVKDTTKCDNITVMETVSNAPDAFDWKDKGAVTPVKDQKNCASCWAFGATGSVEGAYAIKYKTQVVLSEQQLVDCDKQSGGCNGGGFPENAFTELIIQGGQESEADYPYTARNGTSCEFDSSKAAAKVTGCHRYVTQNDTDVPLKDVLYNNGPLAVAVFSIDFYFFKKGILTYCIFLYLDRAVLLTGYGRDNNTDFWNVKNSWGEDTGENGYVRIQRGVGCLGIGMETSIAVVG